MIHQALHLKDRFPFLAEEGRDPTLTTYLPYNASPSDARHPAILECKERWNTNW